MCGFAGFVSAGAAPANVERLSHDLSADLCHRGPDGQGVWREAGDGWRGLLVHRRLAVIDPSPRSDQPMSIAGGRLTVAFNGEIYNYRELRDELPPREWRTGGDTEVLLAAYERWGPAFAGRLRGMFAFALIDRRNGGRPRVILGRDLMGQKPLYAADLPGGGVAFASELRPLRRILGSLEVDCNVDEHAISHYLAYGYVPVEKSVYRGIRSIRPDTVEFAKAATEVEDFPEHGQNPRLPSRLVGDLKEQTKRSVTQAVERRLVSDVPVGCLLSGGIDSSIVALCMKKAAGDVRTFAVGFDGDARYDESPHAEAVARHLGTRHETFRVSVDSVDFAEDLPKLARVFGEPFGDSSAVPTHLLSREVARRVKVALGGDGGDELFGGYDRYRALAVTQRLRLLGKVKPLAGLLPGRHPKSVGTRLRRLFASADLPAAERYAAYLRIFSTEQAAELWPDGPRVPVYELAGDDLIAAAAALDRATYLPGDLLTKVDRCSMLHGLEVRSPFMDRDLVQFATTLRGRDLVRGGRGKALLRAAFAGDLPPEVFRRRKMGFAAPVGDWLRREPLAVDVVGFDLFRRRFFGPVRPFLSCADCPTSTTRGALTTGSGF